MPLMPQLKLYFFHCRYKLEHPILFLPLTLFLKRFVGFSVHIFLHSANTFGLIMVEALFYQLFANSNCAFSIKFKAICNALILRSSKAC